MQAVIWLYADGILDIMAVADDRCQLALHTRQVSPLVFAVFEWTVCWPVPMGKQVRLIACTVEFHSMLPLRDRPGATRTPCISRGLGWKQPERVARAASCARDRTRSENPWRCGPSTRRAGRLYPEETRAHPDWVRSTVQRWCRSCRSLSRAKITDRSPRPPPPTPTLSRCLSHSIVTPV